MREDRDRKRRAIATPPQAPQGGRFSQVYLDRREPAADSKRMRRRLAALVHEFYDLRRLSEVVPRELGIDVPWSPRGPHWAKFLDQCDMRDVLDFVTVAFRLIVQEVQSGASTNRDAPSKWTQEVRRIFAEENVHYTVDDFGGVHPRIDDQFARNSAAAIASLQAPRYSNALHAFEGGMAALAEAPPDGKGAIRGVFSAAEAVFKLILPKVPRLGASEADGFLSHACGWRSAKKKKS